MTPRGELSSGCISLSRPRKANYTDRGTGFGCLVAALQVLLNMLTVGGATHALLLAIVFLLQGRLLYFPDMRRRFCRRPGTPASICEQTRRTRGHGLVEIVQELKTALTGWKACFGIAEVLSPLREIDKGVRRQLRCYAWKQWGYPNWLRSRQNEDCRYSRSCRIRDPHVQWCG